MILSHKIRLAPNNRQASFFDRCAGTARFTWNLGLARWRELYEAGEKTGWRKINAEVNARKKDDLAWLYELPCEVTNNAMRDLGKSFQNFFRRVKAGDSKVGYPRFKSKKRAKPSFGLEARQTKLKGKKIKLPKLGWVKTREKLRFPGKILSARITKTAGHWYASINVEVDGSWSYPHSCENQAEVVGIDLGLKDLAVLSDGTRIEATRVLRKNELKLRRINKELARRTKGGKNWYKTKEKLSRLHKRITDIRRDVTHKMTTNIVKHFGVIGVEDLCVKGMARTNLAKSVHDAAMSEALRQLEYKAPLAGGTIIKADRWYPSSKTCHVCGVIRESLTLNIRQWACDSCGTEHDRDDNAAQNLRNMAAARAVTTCCHGSSGSPTTLSRGTKLPSGQESSNPTTLVEGC